MADIKPVVTTILLLFAIAALFYWSYREYSSAGQVNFVAALAAAGGIALFLSVLKVWNPNVLSSSRAVATSMDSVPVEKKIFYKADDSNSFNKKRWWRE